MQKVKDCSPREHRMRRRVTNRTRHPDSADGNGRSRKQSSAHGRPTNRLAESGTDWQRPAALLISAEDEQTLAATIRFRSLMKHSGDAICFVDVQQRITMWNDAVEQMFQYTGEQLRELPLQLLIPVGKSDNSDCRFPESPMMNFPGIATPSLNGRRADGTEFPVSVTTASVSPGHESLVVIRDETLRRRLECEVLEAAAIECRRIGQDLHDVTGQELTALSLFASGLAKMLELTRRTQSSEPDGIVIGSRDYQKLVDTVDGLRQGLADASKHAHDLSHGILPFPIEPTELEDRLQTLCEMISGLRSIHCQVSYPPEVRHINGILNCDTSTQLYRIVQEAVTNAVKHGHADQIQIALKHHCGHLTLEVRDNGTGLSNSAVRANGNCPAGAGLRNMAYRARQIGGVLETEAAASNGDRRGTVVRCVVPIRGH